MGAFQECTDTCDIKGDDLGFAYEFRGRECEAK